MAIRKKVLRFKKNGAQKFVTKVSFIVELLTLAPKARQWRKVRARVDAKLKPLLERL